MGRGRRVPLPSLPLLQLVLLLMLLLAPLQEVGAFTVDVAAGTSECFTAVASSGEEVFGNYEILTEGSYAPVEVTVRVTAVVVLWRRRRKASWFDSSGRGSVDGPRNWRSIDPLPDQPIKSIDLSDDPRR